MNCQHCGASLDVQKKFCPECGERLIPQDTSQAGSKKTSLLFKILLTIIILIVLSVVLIALTSEDVTDTVDKQLNAIKQGKITEAYYDHTSKAFQQATSLEQFREFLKAYPELADSKSIRFVDRNVDVDKGVLQARLTTTEGVEVPIQYTMVREGDNWKIVNILLDRTHAEKQEVIFDKSSLENVIVEQLNLIRQGKLREAYDKFTSTSFKKATAFESFEAFIRSQPGISDNVTIELGKLSFDNNMGTMSGFLKGHDGLIYPVEYDLVQEGGEWKVMHIEVEKPLDSSKGDTLSVTQVVLGTSVDAAGIVTDPQKQFKVDSGDIYLNLHVANVKPGTVVEVSLEHLDSHSSIVPISTHLDEGGNANAVFIFSPPKTGWPEGGVQNQSYSIIWL